MNAIEFVAQMSRPCIKAKFELSASEYFDTEVGQKMMLFIAGNVKVVDETSFSLQDWEITKSFHMNPLYSGRNFFSDMEDLGFTCEIISYHDKNAPVRTYLFKANK